MDDLQRQVQEAIDELVGSGAERGMQVAVYRHGEQVVDAVAGAADPATGRPVTSDTPFYCYSVGKGATSTIAHLLVERGLFADDTPIAELWPEFGAHGKQTATVRHALTHSLGVPGVPADTTTEDLCDWDRMCAVIADATPWWEPGTKTGYHAYTFGYVVGQIDGVRLVTPERLRELSTPAMRGTDQVFGNEVTWGLGFAIGQLGSDSQATPTAFGMGGVGGTWAYADTATGTAAAVLKNRLSLDFTVAEQRVGIITKAV